MSDLYPYQQAGVKWLEDRPRALLGDEPGVGKSAQLLKAAEGRTLVVAPAMVLDGGTWDDEHAKWAPDLDLTQVSYSSLNQRARTEKGGSTVLDDLRSEYTGHYDTVILDEAHYVKGRKTHWTRAVKQLRCDQMYLATGTPIPNWANELFVLLQLIWPERARPGQDFGSYWRWAKLWFNIYELWGGMKVGKPLDDTDTGWLRFHQDNLGDRFLQRLRDDVQPDLPPLTTQRVMCPMTPAQARVYKSLKKDFIAFLENGSELIAWNTAAQTTQLAKCCTDLSLLNSSAKPRGKFDQLRWRLESQARPSLVAGHFRRTVNTAAEVAASLGLDAWVIHGGTPRAERRRIIERFKQGNVPVLCATIDTISEGLNLVAADTVHLIERSWRPSRNEQVIRRLHRLGQTRPVTVLEYVTPDTADEHMLRVLAGKTDQAMAALRPRELAQLLR